MRNKSILIVLALAALSIRAANAQDLSPKEMAAGKKLAAAKCYSCHKWHDPSAYSQEQWETWMEKMKRKARLSDENYESLIRYFTALRAQSNQPTNSTP